MGEVNLLFTIDDVRLCMRCFAPLIRSATLRAGFAQVSFAELWRNSGAVVVADLDGNEIVDFGDVREFAEVWLKCCPIGWPLK